MYANIKTHKTDWPDGFIMSSRGTATEYLPQCTEFKLKPYMYAQLHDSYRKDTKSFLKYIETIKETKAPRGPDTTLNSWDVVNFYPNCNTEMCTNAVRRVVEGNPQIDLEVSLEWHLKSRCHQVMGALHTVSSPRSMGLQ